LAVAGVSTSMNELLAAPFRVDIDQRLAEKLPA
jgi:hypothetical protein